MSMHEGHRARVKRRFREEGLDHFEPHQVLELLLFYAVPQRDTNPLAHELIERFGSLAQVLEATPEELEKVPGVKEHVSTFLSLVRDVGRYYLVDRAMREEILDDTEKCGKYLIPFFVGRRNETVFLLCLDAKCKVLGCKEVGEGSVNSAGVPIRKIVEMALAANATTVVLAHNHPSGVAIPSPEDIQTTHRVSAALSLVEVTLVDHVVVADGDFVSMAQSGMFRPGEDQVY